MAGVFSMSAGNRTSSCMNSDFFVQSHVEQAYTLHYFLKVNFSGLLNLSMRQFFKGTEAPVIQNLWSGKGLMPAAKDSTGCKVYVCILVEGVKECLLPW